MEHQFKELYSLRENIFDDKLYISEKLLIKLSKYLQKEPLVLRSTEVIEEGWFNKKESYIQRRLKHKRGEGKYYLAISNLYRGYNGRRITKYILYWLNERDVFYINKNMDFEAGGQQVPIRILRDQYSIVDVDTYRKG